MFFRWRHQKFLNQSRKVLWIFIYMRLKKTWKEIFFQVSSCVVSFVSEIQQFEFSNITLLDTILQTCLLEENVCPWGISAVWAFHLHWEMCSSTCILFHGRKVSAFIAKWAPNVFVDYRPPYRWTALIRQHGVSIQNSFKLHETLQQITRKRRTA